MFNQSNGYSLSDIAAVSGRDGAFGGDSGAWWIIILFLFCFAGWGGRGYGGFGSDGSGASANYVLSSDFATLQRQLSDGFASEERKLDSISNGLCDGFYTQAQLSNGVSNTVTATGNSILTQMNNNAINSMQDTFALQTAIGNSLNSITAQMNANEAARQACCCQTNNLITTGFGDMRYSLAEQSCQTRQAVADSTSAIIANQDANTRSILDFLTQDKIATLTAENQGLRFAASQQAQNAYLIDQLGAKVPTAAYIVPNPYASVGCNCCSCGC